MNKQYETANITYKGLTDGKLTVTLIDEKKGKWTIWKKAYQSEEDSEPYQSLQNFKFGATFGVSYQESDESFVNDLGKTINFKKRTIYSIMPPVAHPTSTLKTPKSAPSKEISYKSEEQPKDDKFWEKKAYKQCLWGEYIRLGRPLLQADADQVWKEFQAIEKDADKRFATGWDKAAKTFAEPTSEDQSLADSVPF